MKAIRMNLGNDGKPYDVTHLGLLVILLTIFGWLVLPITWLIIIFENKNYWVTEKTYYTKLKEYSEKQLKRIDNH